MCMGPKLIERPIGDIIEVHWECQWDPIGVLLRPEGDVIGAH